METEFNMNGGYQIITDKILIDATPAFCSFYSTSKRLLECHAKTTDAYVALMNSCDSYLKLLSKPEYALGDSSIIDQLKNWKSILNTSCLIMSSDMDISISIRELLLAKNLPEQIHYIKYIYIQLYRYLERISKEWGIIKKIATEFNIEQEYKAANKSLQNFRDKYYCDRIKEKRNKLYAHLTDTQDYREYHNDVIKIDIEDETKMCIEFMAANDLFRVLLSKIGYLPLLEFVKLKNQTDNEVKQSRSSIFDKIKSLKEVNPKIYETIKKQLDEIYEKFDIQTNTLINE